MNRSRILRIRHNNAVGYFTDTAIFHLGEQQSGSTPPYNSTARAGCTPHGQYKVENLVVLVHAPKLESNTEFHPLYKRNSVENLRDIQIFFQLLSFRS